MNMENSGVCEKQSMVSYGANEEPPYHIVLLCYLSDLILILFGYLRDFLRNTGIEKNKAAVEANREVLVNGR